MMEIKEFEGKYILYYWSYSDYYLFPLDLRIYKFWKSFPVFMYILSLEIIYYRKEIDK